MDNKNMMEEDYITNRRNTNSRRQRNRRGNRSHHHHQNHEDGVLLGGDPSINTNNNNNNTTNEVDGGFIDDNNHNNITSYHYNMFEPTFFTTATTTAGSAPAAATAPAIHHDPTTTGSGSTSAAEVVFASATTSSTSSSLHDAWGSLFEGATTPIEPEGLKNLLTTSSSASSGGGCSGSASSSSNSPPASHDGDHRNHNKINNHNNDHNANAKSSSSSQPKLHNTTKKASSSTLSSSSLQPPRSSNSTTTTTTTTGSKGGITARAATAAAAVAASAVTAATTTISTEAQATVRGGRNRTRTRGEGGGRDSGRPPLPPTSSNTVMAAGRQLHQQLHQQPSYLPADMMVFGAQQQQPSVSSSHDVLSLDGIFNEETRISLDNGGGVLFGNQLLATAMGTTPGAPTALAMAAAAAVAAAAAARSNASVSFAPPVSTTAVQPTQPLPPSSSLLQNIPNHSMLLSSTNLLVPPSIQSLDPTSAAAMFTTTLPQLSTATTIPLQSSLLQIHHNPTPNLPYNTNAAATTNATTAAATTNATIVTATTSSSPATSTTSQVDDNFIAARLEPTPLPVPPPQHPRATTSQGTARAKRQTVGGGSNNNIDRRRKNSSKNADTGRRKGNVKVGHVGATDHRVLSQQSEMLGLHHVRGSNGAATVRPSMSVASPSPGGNAGMIAPGSTSTTATAAVATESLMGTTHAAKWFKRYRELMDFKQFHGHCNVPNDYEPNKQLGRWVKRQRHQYYLYLEQKHTSMTPQRQRLLESIGFVWDSRDTAWDVQYQHLLQFKSLFGHCRVPSNYAPNVSFGQWAKRQRREYKLYKERCLSNTKTKADYEVNDRRFEELKRIGFMFEHRAKGGSGDKKQHGQTNGDDDDSDDESSQPVAGAGTAAFMDIGEHGNNMKSPAAAVKPSLKRKKS